MIRRILLIFMLALSGGCGGGYSFTGASISPDVKTVSVSFFENYAQLINPALSQTVTEKLKDIFLIQTSLEVIQRDGDLQFEGSIIDYSVRPLAIQSDEQAAQNRLTITLSVTFTNTNDPEKDFESRFSRFGDFDSDQDLTAVEDELVEQITTELVQDIFNKSVVNW